MVRPLSREGSPRDIPSPEKNVYQNQHILHPRGAAAGRAAERLPGAREVPYEGVEHEGVEADDWEDEEELGWSIEGGFGVQFARKFPLLF